MKPAANKSIKQWAVDDRPREKAVLKGLDALSDTELIAILIGNGTRNKSALDLSKELYEFMDNSLEKLAQSSIQNMSNAIKGIGTAKATSIAVALELGRRRSKLNAEIIILNNSKKLYEYLLPYFYDKTNEYCYVAYLNPRLRLIALEKHSSGGVTQSIIDPKLLLKRALELGATCISVAHNHPSGNINPSEADRKITARLKEACSFLDILLTDHIIITNNDYYSFADNGMI
jgi:DNA repair protein RadC